MLWTRNGPRLRFGEVQLETDGEQHVFEVQLYLNGLDPKAVRVELYADGVGVDTPVRQEMKLVRPVAGATGSYIYRATMSPARPPADYTARVIPYRAGIAVPLEDSTNPLAAVMKSRGHEDDDESYDDPLNVSGYRRGDVDSARPEQTSDGPSQRLRSVATGSVAYAANGGEKLDGLKSRPPQMPHKYIPGYSDHGSLALLCSREPLE